MKYYDNKTKKGFMSGKGFYLVLAVCLVAVAMAAYSAYSAFESLSDFETESPSSSVIEPAGANKSDVQKTSSDSKVSSEESGSEVQEVSSEKPTSSEPEKPVAKYFVLPVSGNILKDFSADKLQYSITYNDHRLHTGIDIEAPLGTAVKSSGDGTVSDVRTDSLLGVVVEIDHGDGIIGYYCGLADAVKVKKGATVKGGQVIGAVGNIPSESIDPVHLHLEFTKNSEPISPLALMGLEN